VYIETVTDLYAW